MVGRAQWAARAFARYDKDTVDRIVAAAATAAAAKAAEYGQHAVRETGFGVPRHQEFANVAASRGLLDSYHEHDYVSPRTDAHSVDIPRPAGVVLALTSSTTPVAALYRTALVALMTRNVVIISPDPAAKEVCASAAATLAEAAVTAGAPDGVIQIVDDPSGELVRALCADERIDLVIAQTTRAGNTPVLVDETADLAAAASTIVDSKSFDNSARDTAESVLIVTAAVADDLVRHLERAGASLLASDERDRVRALLFPGGTFDPRLLGRDAAWIAGQAGIAVRPDTRILLAPFDLVVPEEPLAHQKPCPVLGLIRVANGARGIDAARAVLRVGCGAGGGGDRGGGDRGGGGQDGHAGRRAAIHSGDARTILAYGAALPVARVGVNGGEGPGGGTVDTDPRPEQMTTWTRMVSRTDGRDFAGPAPWTAPDGPVPGYPHPSNRPSDAAHPSAVT
jgi:acyl-CoA reductase-like NAD-dependent aldehyde dehydrogenase